MVVFAANVTDDTGKLIEDLLFTPEFVKFRLQNKLNLHDNTILIRLAIINLAKNFPDSLQVQQFKAALLRPGEFDEFLKSWIEEKKIPT